MLETIKVVKINKYKIVVFICVYLLIIVFSNFVYALTLDPKFGNLINVAANFSQSITVWSIPASVPLGISYYIGLVLINVYFGILSYFLVFKKNFSMAWWAGGFIVLNLLFVLVLRLKDFLYSGI